MGEAKYFNLIWVISERHTTMASFHLLVPMMSNWNSYMGDFFGILLIVVHTIPKKILEITTSFSSLITSKKFNNYFLFLLTFLIIISRCS
jgi:hypothetical protein